MAIAKRVLYAYVLSALSMCCHRWYCWHVEELDVESLLFRLLLSRLHFATYHPNVHKICFRKSVERTLSIAVSPNQCELSTHRSISSSGIGDRCPRPSVLSVWCAHQTNSSCSVMQAVASSQLEVTTSSGAIQLRDAQNRSGYFLKRLVVLFAETLPCRSSSLESRI